MEFYPWDTHARKVLGVNGICSRGGTYSDCDPYYERGNNINWDGKL